MAQMFPKVFTSESHRTGVKAEKLVYEVIRDYLSDEFYCFHGYRISRKYDKNKIKEREADFILAHKEYGVITIEVKAEKVYFDRKTQSIYQRKLDSDLYTHRPPKKIDIEEQLYGFKNALLNLLKEYLNKDYTKDTITVRPFAALPHTGSTDAMFPLNLTDITFFKENFGNFETSLNKRVLSKKTEDNFDKVIKLLMQRYVEDFIDVKQRLSEIQTIMNERSSHYPKDLWSLWKFSGNMAIIGGAGSGKTQLLIEKATQLGAQEKKVLVTCYNELIEQKLQKTLKDYKNITVSNFHNTAINYIKESKPQLANKDFTNLTRTEVNQWYDEEIPHILSKLLKQDNYKLERFDAILVDEAQDFNLNKWDAIHQLLKENGILHLAVDPTQIVRGEKQDSLDAIIDLDMVFLDRRYTPVPLQINMRNTQRIAKYANEIAQNIKSQFKANDEIYETQLLIPKDSFPLGDKVEQIKINSKEQLHDSIEKILNRYLKNSSIENKDITILVPCGERKLREKSYPIYFNLELGKYKLVQTPKDNSTKEVQLETIRRFKGRENLIIILIDDSSSNDRLRYVGATRASTILKVIKIKDK